MELYPKSFQRICWLKIALDFNLFIILQPLIGTSFSKECKADYDT